MKKLMLLISFVFLSIAAVQGSTQINTQINTQSSTQGNTVLVMGDSLSAAHNIPLEKGWVSLLKHKVLNAEKVILDQNWQIVNASISGETSSGGLARLPSLLEKYKPKVCVIELGGNDGLRGLSLTTMKNNLSKMIQLCKAQQGTVLLLGIWLPPNYGKQYTQAFNNTYPLLADELDVAVYPFLLKGIADVSNLMQSDGIHPTEKAQPLILENVWPSLKTLLTHIHSSRD